MNERAPSLTSEEVNALQAELDSLSRDVDQWCIEFGGARKKDIHATMALLNGRDLARRLMSRLLVVGITNIELHRLLLGDQLAEQDPGSSHVH